jgi:hypothetical protein
MREQHYCNCYITCHRGADTVLRYKLEYGGEVSCRVYEIGDRGSGDLRKICMSTEMYPPTGKSQSLVSGHCERMISGRNDVFSNLLRRANINCLIIIVGLFIVQEDQH